MGPAVPGETVPNRREMRSAVPDASLDRPTILVATPCFGGLVHQRYMLSVIKLMEAAPAAGVAIELELLDGDALITRARAVLAARFLDRLAATHLLFVDADIAFEPEQVMRLLSADKDFVAAFYPLKAVDWAAVPRRVVAGESLASAALSYVGTLEEVGRRTEGDFATAVYAGTGFQLIRRRVFERMITAHPELRFTSVHARAGSLPPSANLYALFDPIIDPETGAYLSEDYSFCRRWRALGEEIWLDLRSRLTHVGPDAFAGDAATRFLPRSISP